MSALHAVASGAASEFLAGIWCADANGALTNVHMIAEKTPAGWVHHPVYTVDDAVTLASTVSARGRNAYFACGAYSKFKVASQGNRTKANAVGASCLWLDLDCGEGKAYPDKRAALRALNHFCKSSGLPKPSFFVDSGNGLHIYWQFDDLVEKEAWRAAATKLKELAEVMGLKADPCRTADIASVLRVPGTCNWKDPKDPKPVVLLETSTQHDLEAFTRTLDAAFQACSPASRAVSLVVDSNELGDNTAQATLSPRPVEEMRAMLRHLAARNFFQDRTGIIRDGRGHIIQVGWIETGMALKAAYGDVEGFDLWSETHEDEQARADAQGQWQSFAAAIQPGHVTIGTIIKAAKSAGFALGMAPTTSGSGFISYGPFTMDPNDGLTKQVKSGRGKAAGLEQAWISPPFEVLGQCRDPQGRGWGKQIRFRDPDGRVHTCHVADARLQGEPASLSGELADAGLQIDRTRQRELAEYLNGVTVSERVTNVIKTGWNEVDGQDVFVLPTETISAATGGRVMLDTAAHGPYEARGSLEDWRRGVGALTAGHALPVFIVSAALAGPLAYLVGAEGGGVHVYGQSSIGKSAMLAAGASVWGRGGTPGYVRSWRATANGLEGAAASATDTCLVLDELGVGSPREVADSIYALANGSGKQRARRDGSLQDPRSWRVFVLSSGELPIETKIAEDYGRKTRAGQTIRLLDIPADRGLGFGAFDHNGGTADAGKLADAIKDAARSAYGTAGPEFVRRLINRGLDLVATETRRMMSTFVTKFVATGASEQIARAAKKFALIGVAGEMAAGLGVTPWATGEARKAAVEAFKRWLETRGGTSSHEENQAIEQVRLMIIQHGEARFESADTPLSPVRDRLGWYKGQGSQREWWVPPESWKAEFCAGLDPTSVARALEARGMLRRQDKKNLTCVVALDGGRKTRCYVLTAAVL